MNTQHKIKKDENVPLSASSGRPKFNRGRHLQRHRTVRMDNQFCVENIIVQKPSRTGIGLDKYHQVTFYPIPVHTQTTSKQIEVIGLFHLSNNHFSSLTYSFEHRLLQSCYRRESLCGLGILQ
jgi:hypothetical protein